MSKIGSDIVTAEHLAACDKLVADEVKAGRKMTREEAHVKLSSPKDGGPKKASKKLKEGEFDG